MWYIYLINIFTLSKSKKGVDMKITLKDGSVKEYDKPMSVYEIASDISEGPL